ncbi:gliding motility-associated C-terminal domain-containing protein [Thalassobellus suaedae]|uniref:Gliding motility-associated C-terminal domain-containing protein n=1 Tax=Thalassobellus suaedae TaxID=3074124 RepID=A0ABY9Y7R7_9FLAO|nr:gliding motility-associated C-terminal domain-containing protein [Flavobacteriaceae bacterium HL-DH10]
MKTKSLFRYALNYATFCFVFFWTLLSVNAQCPTVTNSNPIILDASGYTFADLSDDYVTEVGTNGIVWYTDSTGGTIISSTQLLDEGTYYVDDSSGSCGSRTSINVTFQVPPSNQNLDGIFCSNENPDIQMYIDEVLQFDIPSGGSVEIYNDQALTDLAISTDLLSGFYTYYIIFVDEFGNKSQIEDGETIVVESPSDPTPPTTQEFCADTSPTVGDLNPGTASLNFNWYASIDVNGNPSGAPLSSLNSLTNGTYYIQTNNGCKSNTIPVTVTIDTPRNAGTSESLPYCENDIPTADFNLFDILGGTKDLNGTWSGDLITSNGDSGTVNIATLAVGTYINTYTVFSTGICPNATSSVTITIAPAPESGTANTPVEFCLEAITTGQTYNLFDLLTGEDQTGTWSDDDSTSALSGNTVTLDGLSEGTYNFTYNVDAIGSCDDVDVTVQIIINPQPNSGTPSPALFCENDLTANSPLDLFGQLTGNDSGGTWNDDSTTGLLTGSDVDITGLAVGLYNFTYSITNGFGCTNSSTVVVTIAPAPESGTVNTPEEFCLADITTGQTYNLFDLLTDEDQTGTWSDDDSTSALSGNTVTLDGLSAGTYNFTYNVDAIGSCDDVDVTVQIIINPQPNSGTPSPALFCENDLTANSPLDLFGQLTGNDSGGTWNDDSTTGLLTGSDVDITGLAVGLYNFTYSITNGFGCTNSSTVVVTIAPAPESGTVNTPEEFCLADITTGQTYNLFDLLTDEDQTGTWSDDDSTSALSGNTVTLDGLSAGTYNFTYNVDAIGSCDDVDVTVQIIINDTPAPTADTPQEFCDTATVGNLVATGTSIQWYNVATGGTPLAATDALVDGNIYYATQTDATTGCESSVRTAVTAIIYQSPNAGDQNSTGIVACNNGTINLNSGLDGTQDLGGIWYEGSDNTGIVVANPTAYDVTGFTANTYQFTYYVVASSPCVDDSETIIVTIEAPLDAGTNNTLDVCSNNGTTDLFSLIGSAETGGTWSPAMASTTGVFDPLVDASGTYTYLLTNACGTFSSQVDVTVTQAPNAGSDNTALICVIDGVTDLFSFLGTSAQTGGTWSPALTSGTGEFNPNIDAQGIYTYIVAATSPCSSDSMAQITVTVSDTSAPVVLEANPEFCLVDNPVVSDLNSALRFTGTVNWYEDDALTNSANPTDNLVDGEDYYATQTNSDGCESSTNIQVTVTINNTPTPTLVDATKAYCLNDNPQPSISDLTLNITEYDSNTNNIVWYDAESNGNIIGSSTILSNLTSYYAVLVDANTGCESSVRLEVTPDITSCGKLVLPDGFSPNNDGVNDSFDYNNLDILYPNFEIEIFNRYGNVVYKGNASTPRFNGKSNQSRSIGNGDLPVGVYYYIFKFNDNTNKPEQGRLYLSR